MLHRFVPFPVALFVVALGALETEVAAADACAPYRIDWTFRAGSPISEPIAVDAVGQVFVATHEGSVQGLGADGRFLWSYTTTGGLLHGVSVDDLGRVYTASSDGKLWSFGADGRARWVFQLPARAESALVIGPKHAVTFVNGAALHAVSSRAGMLWGVPLGSAPSIDPRLSPSGETWVATTGGWLHAIRTPYQHRRWQVADGAVEQLSVGRDFALVRRAGRASSVDDTGNVRFTVEGVAAAAIDVAGSDSAVLVRDGAVEFRELGTGRVEANVVLASSLSAAPLLVGAVAFLPEADGELVIVARTGAVSRCHLSDAALLEPVWASAGGRVVVGAGNGALAAVVPSGTSE